MSDKPGDDFESWLADQLGRREAAGGEEGTDEDGDRAGDAGAPEGASPVPPTLDAATFAQQHPAPPSPPNAPAPPSPPPPETPAEPWSVSPPPLVVPPAPPGGFDWGLGAAAASPEAAGEDARLPDPGSSPTPGLPLDELPTQAFDPFAEEETSAFAVGSGSEPGAGEPFAVPTADREGFASDAQTERLDRGDALDDLFGESSFKEYGDERLIPALGAGPEVSASPPSPAGPGADGATPPSGTRSTQRTLFWALGGVIALIALGILFVLGTKLPSLLGPAPVISASPSPSPSPSLDAERPLGPVDPGTHRWDELLGGECLEPYTNPWADEFTVVDCALPHSGQLVVRGALPEELASSVAYPGEAALRSPLAVLCTSSDVVDYAAAGRYSDIQFDSSYPVDQEQWNDGPKDYFCFLSRASGEPMEGTLAKPPVIPPAEETPAR